MSPPGCAVCRTLGMLALATNSRRPALVMDRSNDLAEVDWRSADPLRIMLLGYTLGSRAIVLNDGTANRLFLSNIAHKTKPFVSQLF